MNKDISEFCEHKLCITPLHTGRCNDECLKRFESEIGKKKDSSKKEDTNE